MRTRGRIGTTLLLAAVAGAALSGCGEHPTATAPALADAVRVQQVAARSTGCAPGGSGIPKYADVSSIGDVDGDGRADRQFHSVHTGEYGIRTASGATIVLHDNLPATNQHGGWTAKVGASVITAIDDGRTAEVFRFTGCRFVPMTTRYGLPFLSALSHGGTGPQDGDLARYGLTCVGTGGSRSLANTIAVKDDDGSWLLRTFMVRKVGVGSLRPEREPSSTQRLKAADRRIQQASDSRCGNDPKVFSDGR